MSTSVNRKTVVAAVFVLVLLASLVVMSLGYFEGAPGTQEPRFESPPTEEWNRTYGEKSGEERAFLVYSLTQVDDSCVLIGDAEVPTKMENSWFGVANETGELTTREVVKDGSINAVTPARDRKSVV